MLMSKNIYLLYNTHSYYKYQEFLGSWSQGQDASSYLLKNTL